MGIRDILNEKEDAIMGKGVSDEKIRDAELELGLTFDKEYAEYLKTVGLAMCNGHELTGIGKEERTNVVSVTRQMKQFKGDIPDDWYVIENENMDGACLWQNSEGEIFFNRRKEYDSLLEFLKDL